jgi:hypothetical protein
MKKDDLKILVGTNPAALDAVLDLVLELPDVDGRLDAVLKAAYLARLEAQKSTVDATSQRLDAEIKALKGK